MAFMISKCRGLMNTTVIYSSAAAVIAAGVTAVFRRGFFFAEDMYPFEAGWFILWPMLVLVKMMISNLKETCLHIQGRGKKDRSLAVITMRSGPFIMVVLYGLSWLRGPVSFQGTMNELLRWSLYGTFMILIFISLRSKGSALLVTAGWHVIGMVLSLSALLVVCGGLPFPNFIAYSTDTAVSVTGARLAGLLQYPNTFGAVMAVFLLERLFAVSEFYTGSKERAGTGSGEWTGMESASGGRTGSGSVNGRRMGTGSVSGERSGSGSVRGERTGWALLRLLPLFPYTAALLLSESRGAWLAAACACAAVLPLKRRQLAPLLAAGAAPVAAAALLYRQLAAARLAVEPLPGLLTLAGLWAGALLAGLWLCRRQRSLARGSRAAVLLAALGWTAGAAAVLQQVHERMTGPSSTVSARALLYRDAWRLAAEAPWLGRGGETWRNVYLSAQSRPYVGSQIHSGYLDILLNLGIVGLVVTVLMLSAMCWLVVVSSPRFSPPFLVIVLHSGVDFDWSYGLVWLLLFWLTALAVANKRSVQPRQAFHPKFTVRQVESLSSSIFLNLKLILAIAVFSSSLFLCIASWRAQAGEALYRKAVVLSDSTEREALLQQSLFWNPLSPRIASALAENLPPIKSYRLLKISLGYSPENPALNWRMAEIMMNENRLGDTLYWIRRSLRLDVYNFSTRTKSIHAMLTLAERRLAAGDKVGALLSASSGLELLRQYELLAGRANNEDYNDRSFHLTKQAIDLGHQLESLILWIPAR